jgi:hypothetical protein
MSKPPKSLPPPQLRNVKRTRGRFRETEFARASRVAKAIGAERVEVDPTTGKISVILAKGGEADAAESPTDLLPKL